MSSRSRIVLGLIAVLVVAPIGAAVIISALLLFGVEPHTVFLPGWFVQSRLRALGFRAPNPVAVMSTAVFWWAIIVGVWLAVRRLLRRA
jgi:hypothetical protein